MFLFLYATKTYKMPTKRLLYHFQTMTIQKTPLGAAASWYREQFIRKSLNLKQAINSVIPITFFFLEKGENKASGLQRLEFVKDPQIAKCTPLCQI